MNNQPTTRSNNQETNPPIKHPTMQPANQSITIKQPIKHTVNQSTNPQHKASSQHANQPIVHAANQAFNRTYTQTSIER